MDPEDGGDLAGTGIYMGSGGFFGGAGTAVAPMRVRPAPKPDAKPADADPEQPRQWHVVLLDDDEHSYEYVIVMAQALFGMTVEAAFEIAKRVDRDGRAVCMTTHRELAELKQEQVHAFGADPLIASCQGAMSAVLEPADFAGDEAGDEAGDGVGDDTGNTAGG